MRIPVFLSPPALKNESIRPLPEPVPPEPPPSPGSGSSSARCHFFVFDAVLAADEPAVPKMFKHSMRVVRGISSAVAGSSGSESDSACDGVG